jgi:hypothetical protein
MSSIKNSIALFFKENERQKWFLIAYCSFILLLCILRVLRNNQEFLFFSGVLAALYYFYNNSLFSFTLLKYVYFAIDIILFLIFLAIGKETISMLFPITTFCYLLTGRFIFVLLFKREPQIDILLQSNSDKLYTVIMFLCVIATWIAIVAKFMDHHIV